MRSGKVILGVLAGIAIGAALGVLFAPDNGWNTRMRISKKAEDLTDEFEDKVEEFLESISEDRFEVSDKAADFSARSREKRTGT